MTTRSVSTESERVSLITLLRKRPLPFSVEITKGRKRTSEQNRTAFMWYSEIAEQMGDRTPTEVRGECKLRFGVPIMREASESFREAYDRVVKPLSYEQKLALMVEPFDLPVTRIMHTPQLTRYLDEIHREYSAQGVVLTIPNEPPVSPEGKAA